MTRNPLQSTSIRNQAQSIHRESSLIETANKLLKVANEIQLNQNSNKKLVILRTRARSSIKIYYRGRSS